MRLEDHQRDFIKLLAKRKIGGESDGEVLRWLVQYAIIEMTKNEYIQKHISMRNVLRATLQLVAY